MQWLSRSQSIYAFYTPDTDSLNNGFLGYAYFCFCATSGIDSWDMHVPLEGRPYRRGVHVHMRGGSPSEERCVQLGKCPLEASYGADWPCFCPLAAR